MRDLVLAMQENIQLPMLLCFIFYIWIVNKISCGISVGRLLHGPSCQKLITDIPGLKPIVDIYQGKKTV